MPYFFICPLYALLLLCLFTLAVVARFVPRFRNYSSYLAIGAVGTIPGFVIGNALFWLCVVGAAIVLKKPLDHLDGVFKTGAAFGFVAVFLAGLVMANVGGCAIGFLFGLWLRRKLRKKNA
jgi:hypothetical protein